MADPISPPNLDRLSRLPAEIRYEIFLLAFIPSNLHLTPSRNPRSTTSPSAHNLSHGILRCSDPTDTSSNRLGFVRLLYFSSSPYPTVIPFIFHNLNITRHFRDELLSLLFTHSNFTFTTISSARYILKYLPRKVLSGITKLTITIGDYSDPPGFHAVEELQRIIPRDCPSLRILTLELRLNIFESKEKSWDHLVKEHTYCTRLAASYVNGFTWPGVETRIPCAERELDADFMRELRRVFGAANVRYVVIGYNEFAGVKGEVVVGGSGRIKEAAGRNGRNVSKKGGHLLYEAGRDR